MVSLLLGDPRTDPNKAQDANSTPLWYASQNGHISVVRVILASEREIDTGTKSSFGEKTAAEMARAVALMERETYETEEDHRRYTTNGPLIADLIDEYERDPEEVRHRLRAELSFFLSCQTFSLFCFLRSRGSQR